MKYNHSTLTKKWIERFSIDWKYGNHIQLLFYTYRHFKTDRKIQLFKYIFYIIFSNISKSLNLKILNHNWKLYLKTVWHLGGNPESASSAMLMTFWGIIGLTSSSLKSSSMSSQAESVSTSFDRALGRICKKMS